MTIRGTRLRCPVCSTALGVSASEPVEKAQCPRCEAALWALAFSSGPVLFVRRPEESALGFLAALMTQQPGTSGQDVALSLKGADSFDLLEILQELEATLALNDQNPMSEGASPDSQE